MSKKNFETILFDWDGCLAKTLDLWLEAYLKILKRYGVVLPPEVVVEKTWGKWADGLALVGVGEAERAYQEILDYMEPRVSQVPLAKGARELLQSLSKAGKKVGLLTSSSRQVIDPSLKKLSLKKSFGVVLTKNDVKKGKPNPEIVNKALKVLGGEKKTALIVGDSYHDVQTGKNAGITTVVYYPPGNKKFYSRQELEAEKPDFLVSSFTALGKIIFAS
ncbi:HAD family hydrolase [Patescibacteria group bacterium]